MYQPYFVAFATAHDQTPEAMDAAQHNNVPFISWISEQWTAFYAEHPEHQERPSSESTDAFTAWLGGRGWLAVSSST